MQQTLEIVLIFHELIDEVEILHDSSGFLMNEEIVVVLSIISDAGSIEVLEGEEFVAKINQVVVKLNTVRFADIELFIEEVQSIFFALKNSL